jgi:hypothetical protein
VGTLHNPKSRAVFLCHSQERVSQSCNQHARAKFNLGSPWKVAKDRRCESCRKMGASRLAFVSRPRRRSFAALLSSVKEAKVSQTLNLSKPRMPPPGNHRPACRGYGTLQLPSCVIVEMASRTKRANTATEVDTRAHRPRRHAQCQECSRNQPDPCRQ